MLRVGYYLAAAREGMILGGTASYSARVLENLLAHAGPMAFHLFIDPRQEAYAHTLRRRFPGRDLSWSTVRLLRPLARLLRPLEGLAVMGRSRAAARAARLLNHLEWQTLRHPVDLIHCPLQLLPVLAWRTPTVITMHDVQELHYPEFFTPYERLARAGSHWWAMELATSVAVSFDYVREDLLRYFALPPEKVRVCSIPVAEGWLPPADPGALARYGLSPGFLLYPAQTWPHKNHSGLLRALAHLRDTVGLRPTLVCTGRQNAHFPAIEAEAAVLGLRGQVRFLGVVPEGDLAALYGACRCVVMPTLYEAGGFPVLEAIMLGVPVIASRVTCLPETLGDPALLFDPHDPVAIATAIRLMLIDDGYYGRARAAVAARRAAYADSPRRSAAAFESLYRAMVPQERRSN